MANRVWVLDIEHEYGHNVTVCATEAVGLQKLAEYVRSEWHNPPACEDEDLPVEPPDDDAEAIGVYFDAMEPRMEDRESYTLEAHDVVGG